MGAPTVVPPRTLRLVCSRYAAGWSAPQISRGIGLSFKVVLRLLKGAGVRIRDPHEYHKQHTLDTDAFERPSPERNYWIGFILADGCVQTSTSGAGNVLSVSLHDRDRNHVENLRRFLKTSAPVLPQKRLSQHRLCIYSQRLIDSLIRIGITPRKSMTASPPEGLSHDRDFWRGVIDGDGCLSHPPEGPPRYGNPVVSLVGSRATVEAFRTYATSFVETRANVYAHKSIWELRVNGLAAIGVVRELYRPGDVALTRKANLAASIAATTYGTRQRDWSHLTPGELMRLYREHGNWSRVADSIGMLRSNLSKIRHQRLKESIQGPSSLPGRAAPGS